MTSPTDPFYSPKLTLARAQHHISDFNDAVQEFIQTKPWSRVVEVDTQAMLDVHKIQFTRKLPEFLPCILFDAANNLRAVLDQSGYAAAIASGKVRPKKTNFPFADDIRSLDDNMTRGRKVCEDLPPEIAAVFRSFNPYKGGNDALWGLNKLCNAKKHCALVPVTIGNPSAFFTATIKGPGWIGEVVSPGGAGIGWDPEKNQVTLWRGPMGSHAAINADLTFEVAIEGIETLGGKSAVGVLDTMSRIVEGILMATEAECRRIRLIP